jgi:hypothetical protein
MFPVFLSCFPAFLIYLSTSPRAGKVAHEFLVLSKSTTPKLRSSEGTSNMSQLAPPRSPPVALDNNDGLYRLRLRLWQLWLTLLTILATAWLITLGPIPGIVGVLTAKHVLVAILVMGLGIDRPDDSG